MLTGIYPFGLLDSPPMLLLVVVVVVEDNKRRVEQPSSSSAITVDAYIDPFGSNWMF